MSSREQRSSTCCSCAVATQLVALGLTFEQKSWTDVAVEEESANQVVRRQTLNVPAELLVPLLTPSTQQVQYSEQTTYVFCRRRHIAYKEPSDTATILSILSCSSPNVDETNTTPFQSSGYTFVPKSAHARCCSRCILRLLSPE